CPEICRCSQKSITCNSATESLKSRTHSRLSISNTGISVFPDLTSIFSLESDFILYICDNLNLRLVPTNAFIGMTSEFITMNLFNNGFQEIESHAFNGTKIDKLVLKNNKYLRVIHEDAFEGAFGPTMLPSDVTSGDSLTLDGPLASDIVGFTSAEDTFGSMDFYYPELDLCQRRPALQCSPEADAFNPCEDIAGFGFLRVAIWFINVLAIVGNLTVLLVLFTSRCKLTVPKFLMCHLAFADLCIGVYLLMIATVDLMTRGHYSQHAIEWQTGVGCGIAGFLSVFGGELSVYTLSTITVERWHTITHALRLERRLGLRHASSIMVVGWVVCLGMALLPLMGVSSYNKVSMCLPMDIETPLSQAYVILLLLFNVGAFLVICSCYVCIYTAVRNPEFPGRAADAKIAKRMAVLIFTDFLCMAPISFFAISAAFKVPLITVTNSKILLVLFYPINSCANPFLYAIFTRAFRKDAYILLSSMGCCESKANLYRMKTYCSENINRSKSSSGSNGNSKAPRAVVWMSSFPHVTPRPRMQRV
ncbi:lutropin-choriogonadotropic hormone receptor-like, partial [Sinocyclocheilus grahami]|uniref:lutropin-choriogonadotropic hormone receptor-like n=1 Tax=Sinocyclocheilus grahami TaxID=75366 RepID=UPI0007AC802A